MQDVLQLTELEKHIYNVYLKTIRSRNNQPYKYRKNFSNLDDIVKKHLKKISIFLNNYKHISLEDFIIAPYEVYRDETHFDLSYYNTLKAAKAYTIYQNNKVNSDVDSDIQLKYIAQSLIFLQNFCIENKITLDLYLQHIPEKIPSFILHLQEYKTNIYTLLGFKDFTKYLYKQDPDLVKFILGEHLYNSVPDMKVKFLKSKKAFMLVTTGLQRIQKKLSLHS
jgi:hypothetical protein